MFKNYMHNELGITKDDIRAWIKEAVHEEAIRLVDQQVGKFSVQDQVNKLINDNYRLRNDLANAIAKRIMIKVTCDTTGTNAEDPMFGWH